MMAGDAGAWLGAAGRGAIWLRALLAAGRCCCCCCWREQRARGAGVHFTVWGCNSASPAPIATLGAVARAPAQTPLTPRAVQDRGATKPSNPRATWASVRRACKQQVRIVGFQGGCRRSAGVNNGSISCKKAGYTGKEVAARCCCCGCCCNGRGLACNDAHASRQVHSGMISKQTRAPARRQAAAPLRGA